MGLAGCLPGVLISIAHARQVVAEVILIFFIHHRDAESTERTLFLPDRETAIGQKNSALRALPFSGEARGFFSLTALDIIRHRVSSIQHPVASI